MNLRNGPLVTSPTLPLDEIDGAARVLDPIFCHVKEPKSWRVRGRFFRNYYVAGW